MNIHRPARALAALNCDGRRGLALLAACALLFLPEIGGDAVREALRYEREALGAGQIWRLVTAHVVHLGPGHAALNALGLALIWALFGRDYTAPQWLGIVVLATIGIDAGLWLRDSTVEWYVGSSGVLHGALAAGAFAHAGRREIDGWVLGAFLAAKLGHEQWSGASALLDADVPVIVNAHLYGALSGLAAAALLHVRGRARAGTNAASPR